MRIKEPSEDPDSWRNELKAEEPLLLHPYDDDKNADPEDHITFDENGIPCPVNKSPRGRETIDVCNLDRHRLIIARLTEKRNVLRGRIYDECSSSPKENERFFRKDEQYSAWMNRCVDLMLEKFARRQNR